MRFGNWADIVVGGALCLALSSCAVPIRASAHRFMPTLPRNMIIAAEMDPVVDAVKVELVAQGFTLQGVYPSTQAGKVFAFSKVRRLGTYANDMTGLSGSTVMSMGSFLAIVARPFPSGGTALLFVGRPTIAGVAVCDDDDQVLTDLTVEPTKWYCRDTKASRDHAIRRWATGSEEAGSISALQDALKRRFPVQPAQRPGNQA